MPKRKRSSEPIGISEAFDEYSSAVGDVHRCQKQVDDWKTQHPGADPGVLLGQLGAAMKKREKALDTLNRVKANNKSRH